MARANVVSCSIGLDARAAPVEICFERDLSLAPSHEQPDAAPFSFAFSGLHDGGALPLPLPLPLPGQGGCEEEEAGEGAARRAAHVHYGHVVGALLEAKRAVDAVITGAGSSSLSGVAGAAAGEGAAGSAAVGEGAACDGVDEGRGGNVPTKKAKTMR
jgi:hypothetical protein